ncbi:DoxX family protein [Haladaptatus sp. NG-SE-30]
MDSTSRTTDLYDSYRRFLEPYARADGAVLRVGLGILIFIAGLDKLFEPMVWARYTAPVIAALWPFPLGLSMVLNGVVEMVFGVALLVRFYTPLVAGITALSLAGVVVNLIIGALQTGQFVDVLIRDIGLTLFAFGVTLRSMRPERRRDKTSASSKK